MSETRTITEGEWEEHRNVIERLYESKTLKEVMALMEQDYGFKQKKGQYTRKFKQWNIIKYSTSDKWKFVARKLEKRKHEGKESEIYINGKLIEHKKIQKEISRNIPPSYYSTIDTVDFPGTQINQQYPAFSPCNNWIAPGFPVFLEPCRLDSPIIQLPFPEQQWSFLNMQAPPQTGFPIEFPDDFIQFLGPPAEPTTEVQTSPTSQASNEEARSVLVDIIGDQFEDHNRSLDGDLNSAITSQLDGFLPERKDGELVQNVKKIFDLSSMINTSTQLLRFVVFLSSNNLFSEFRIDKFLTWIIKTHQSFLIERLIRIKTPTVEIFLSHLLLSATRLKEIDMVLAILSHGIDVNTPAGGSLKTTALHEATADQNVHLVRLFLNAGANPNLSLMFGRRLSPLQVSIRERWDVQIRSNNNHELIQMLLDAGGDANVAPVVDEISHTLLTFAALSCDAILVRMLLKSKAEVNMMTMTSITALQAAAYANEVEIVQILVDAGADIDAPFGNRYETARLAAVKDLDYKHLVSPIQYAAYNNNIEMVQILLDWDANVDGYSSVEYDNIISDDDNDDDLFTMAHLQTPLQLAVSNENSILVRLLLSAGADTNAQQHGDTPLQIAAKNDDIALVRLLLRNGAHVNTAAYKLGGRTALQAAAYTGNSELVHMLLGRGANVSAPPALQDGRTAIQAAAQGGHIEILRMLMDLGAKINTEAGYTGGRTCLQAAAENGHTDMIRLLLRFGADMNAPAARQSRRTALQAAIEQDDSASIDILLKAGADINAAPSSLKGISALCAAIHNNNLTLVQRLLVTADPNEASSPHPPIIEAVQHGNIDLIQSLIEAGADVNVLGQNEGKSQTALQAAIDCGDIEIVHVLLKAQADVNSSSDGNSLKPLELAVFKNRSDIVRTVLANGASVNPAPSVGSPETTALGLALGRWSVSDEMVKDLISAGADVNRGGNNHGLPLSAAVGNYDLTKCLLDAGAKVNGQWPGRPTALQQACKGVNIDIIRLLLDAGADINAPAVPKHGRTALQAAVQHGTPPIIKLLLQNGADCNAPAAKSHGGTALQLAAMEGKIAVVLLLLRAGAEINAAPSITGGRTALEIAAEHGRLDVVSLLLKNDADVDGLDARCLRAANLAGANGHPVISRILKEYKRRDSNEKE